MRTLTCLGLVLAFIALAACGHEDAPRLPDPSTGGMPTEASAPEAGGPEPTWRAEVLFQAPDKLGGCAVGDLDPTKPGLEIATVSRNGDVWVLGRGDEGWEAERIGVTAGEMIQCAIGDARLDRPGEELVVVGMASGTEEQGGLGEARLFFRDGDGWGQELVFQDSELIHGVAVADMDPDRDGNQIVTVGFSHNAVVLDRTPDEGWRPIRVVPIGSPGKSVVPFDFGVAVATAGGAVKHITHADGDWRVRDLWRGTAGAARLGTAGYAVLVACDDGKLRLIETEEGAKGTWVIHEEGAKLRGAVLLRPDEDVWQAATAGYEQKVTILRLKDEPRAIEVYRDDAKLHHLAAGDILPDRPGKELVTCGYSGRVVLISRE